MRYVILILFIFVFTATVGNAQPYPFTKEADDRFKTIENMTGSVTFAKSACEHTYNCTGTSTIGAGVVTQAMQVAPTADGLHSGRVARITYDFSKHGGASDSSISLGVALPASAVIHDGYYVITTAVTSASDNTMALSCAASNDLLGGVNMSGQTLNLGYELSLNGSSAASAVILHTACTPWLDIGSQDSGVTAGKVIFLLEYDILE